MNILFIGGTQFVGRHMVAEALSRGHRVTLFNRGKTNAGLFPEAEKLLGDRDGGLDVLKKRQWDAVVDVNGYVPRLVRNSASFLKGSVGRYLFISTGSVYDFTQIKPGGDESSPLEKLEDETTEEWFGPAYGGLKVLCENMVRDIFPEQHLILRLGVVAGPHDPTDRVTYWVSRTARGGEMLVAGAPQARLQFIDARDLATFALHGLEQGLSGVYNTVGNSITWDHFLNACSQACGVLPDLIWVNDFKFLSQNIKMDSRTFGTLPMVVPPEYSHISTLGSQRALEAGLVYRSTLNTARDVFYWDRERSREEPRVAGLEGEEESAAIMKWKSLQ